LPIELRVKDPLPGSKIKTPCRDGNDHFVMNQQRLQMRIAIVLAGLVMFVISLERRQML